MLCPGVTRLALGRSGLGVVQRAVTLWRLPPPSGACRVAAASPSGLGVWRERPSQLPPLGTWVQEDVWGAVLALVLSGWVSV